MSQNDDGKRSGDPEGWESLAEEPGGTLAPNEELEEALREAAEAVDAAHGGGPKPAKAEAPDAPAPAEGESGSDEVSPEVAREREKLLRLHADFENFRRRAFKERQEMRHYGHQNLVKDLLPTVDNLERAIDHVRQSEGGDLESLLKGVELVYKELLSVLAKHGVSEIEARGAPFDPALHEAMAQAPDPSNPPNTVIEVLEKGYQLRDRLVRPSRVVVASAPPEPQKQQQAEDEGSD